MRALILALLLFIPLPSHAQAPALTCADWQDPAFWQDENAPDVSECTRDRRFVGQTDAEGWTPLHFAAAYSAKLRDFRMFSYADADFLAQTNSGETPWDIANRLQEGSRTTDLLFVYQQRAERAAAEADDSISIVEIVQMRGSISLIIQRLKDGADPDIRNEAGDTALVAALRGYMAGRPSLVQRLLDAGADVNARGEGGMQPLHWAVRSHENAEIVRMLIAAGAEINSLNDSGNSPLSVAAHYARQLTVFTLLLDAGAGPEHSQ